MRAANWQNITIDVAPGLRSHILGNPAVSQHYSSASLVEVGSGGEMALRVSTLFDLGQPFTLFDFGSLQSLSIDGGGGTFIDARRGQWTNDPSPPMLFFVLPWSLWGHEFALVHPNGGTYPVTKLPLSAGAGYGDGFEAWAICTPEQEFWLVDLTTYLRSPSWDTYPVWATWVESPGLTPLVAVQIGLDAQEDGHRFTVHSRASGGPEILSSVVADAGSLGFSIGAGMEFWVTRNADGASSLAGGGAWVADPSQTTTGSDQIAVLYGSASGIFPDPPERGYALEPQTFRVHWQRAAHVFTVWMSDGYRTAVAAEAISLQQIATSAGGDPLWNPLDVFTFTVPTDPTRAWWLRDDTTGEVFPAGRTDVLDGWKPLTAEPEWALPTITLRLPGWRSGSFYFLEAAAPPGSTGIPCDTEGGIWGEQILAGADGMASYTISTVAISLSSHSPSSGPDRVSDAGAGPWWGAVQPGENDLLNWLPPVESRYLTVSTSRFGHELLLRHPNGEAYPVLKGQTQGSLWFAPNGLGWQVSYYYFDATASYRPVLPWYVEDASNGERIGPNPTNAQLINWIAIADPKNLTKEENADGTFVLTWTFSETSTDAAFKLERRESDSEEWHLLDIFTAAETLNPVEHTARARTTLAPSEPGKTASIRVFYEYSGQCSAPSNIVHLRNDDFDDDGMPDWWENAHGLLFDDATDANGDADLDGITNKNEFTNGTDPWNFYNDILPFVAPVTGNNQTGAPLAWLADALVVQVMKTDRVTPLADAPVTFTVALGKGKISATSGGIEAASVTLKTDANGQASVFYHSPNRHSVVSRITVTAKAGVRSAQTFFKATTEPDADPANDPANAPDEDWDEDGLTNAEEQEIGSDPNDSQSDEDGVTDGMDAMPADGDISFPRVRATNYALIDMGPGVLTAMNTKGQAVGIVQPADGTQDDPTAFFWDNGERKTLKGRKPEPRAVNDSGQIVGQAEFPTPGFPEQYHTHAAYWATPDAEPVDLGALIEKDGDDPDKQIGPAEKGRSVAVAINNSGTIVGNSSWFVTSDQSVGSKAVQFKPGGKPLHLGPGEADAKDMAVTVSALDENGDAVGFITGGSNAGGALWEGGKYSKNLGTDVRPSGIATAPPEDLRYKHFIAGNDNYSAEGVLLLAPKDGSGFITKTLPIRYPLGITANGFAVTASSHAWRNGNDDDFTSAISVPDDATFDGVVVQTVNGLIGGTITDNSAPAGLAGAGNTSSAGTKRAVHFLPGREFVPLTPEAVNWGFDPWLQGDKSWAQGSGWTHNIDVALKETWTSVSLGGAYSYNQHLAIAFETEDIAKKVQLYIPPASQPFIELAPPPVLGRFNQLKITGKAAGLPITPPEVWVVPKFRKNVQAPPTEKDCAVRLKVMAMPMRTLKVGIWRAAGLAPNVPTDAEIIARMKESYRQACIDVVQTHAGAVASADWDANGDGFFTYGPTSPDNILLTNSSKLAAKMNIVILPKCNNDPPSITFGVVVSPKCAAIFAESYAPGLMAIADLPYTCAHEGGHLLTVSTRDSEPAAGVQEKRHDPGPYPIYWWTNTTQLLLGGKVATPGYFTDDKNEANYNIRHYNFALKHHTKRHMAESIMQAGAGQYKWLRHEDWEVANKKAKDFE